MVAVLLIILGHLTALLAPLTGGAMRAAPRACLFMAPRPRSGPEDWLTDVSDLDDEEPKVRYSSLVDSDAEAIEAAEDAALEAFLAELGGERATRPRSTDRAPERSRSTRSRRAPASADRGGRRSSRGSTAPFKGGDSGSPHGGGSPVSTPSGGGGGTPPVYAKPDADGIESSSYGGQLVTLVPTKVMVFIDGSWLYYTLFERGRRCPIRQRYGAGWYHSHHVDWNGLPQLISDHVSAELVRMQPYNERAIEVTRVLVYSSFREDQAVDTQRDRMFRALQALNFEVHLGSFTGAQEKCVDISLAVDMLHYATIPHALDVAVLVSGDRDFIPALLRTRQKGKRVALCSMRNSASAEFNDPNAHVKDFDVLWLDDHLDKLIAPVHPSLQNQRPAMVRMLHGIVLDSVAEAGGSIGLLQLRAHLAQVALGSSTALQYISHEFGSLPAFLRRFPNDLSLRQAANREALVALLSTAQQLPSADAEEEQGAPSAEEFSAQLEAAELMAGVIEADGLYYEDEDEGGEAGVEPLLHEGASFVTGASAATTSVQEVLAVAEQLLPSAPAAWEVEGAADNGARAREQKAALREKLLLLLDTLVEEETPAYELDVAGSPGDEQTETRAALGIDGAPPPNDGDAELHAAGGGGPA